MKDTLIDSENLQTFCRLYINEIINDYFGDMKTANNSRKFTKEVLIHKETDSFLLTIGRLLLKNEICNQLDEKIFGLPSTYFNLLFNYNPNIILKFSEKNKPKTRDFYSKSQITYQIPNSILNKVIIPETKEINMNLLLDEIKEIANKIFSSFKDFNYKTGVNKISYEDKTENIKILLFTDTQTKGEEIVKKILNTIDLPLNEEKLTMGKSKKQPKKGVRSIFTTVFFKRAEFIAKEGEAKIIATNSSFIK
jgi:hypothetical protein